MGPCVEGLGARWERSLQRSPAQVRPFRVGSAARPVLCRRDETRGAR